MTTKKEIFAQLSGLDITPFVEKKGALDYISWAATLHILQSLYNEVSYEVGEHKDKDGVLQLVRQTGTGACVVVRLQVEGFDHVEVFPIMDNRNKSVPLADVDARDVSDSVKRAFVKAAAHFGLGLSLYNKTAMPKSAQVARALQPQAERFVETGEKLAAVATLTELKALFKDMLGDEREEFKLQVKAKKEGFANV